MCTSTGTSKKKSNRNVQQIWVYTKDFIIENQSKSCLNSISLIIRTNHSSSCNSKYILISWTSISKHSVTCNISSMEKSRFWKWSPLKHLQVYYLTAIACIPDGVQSYNLSEIAEVNQRHGYNENDQELVNGVEEKPRAAPRVVHHMRSFQTSINGC